MTVSDLIVVAPWIAFGIALLAVCFRLRRSGRRPGRDPGDPAVPARHRHTRQAGGGTRAEQEE
jgi:hypothetical protein